MYLDADRPPYSYRIPEEFPGNAGGWDASSCAFGRGRLIQGIVLGLESQSDEEEMEQDLKILPRCGFFSCSHARTTLAGEELRKSVFSYKISILKAMLPGFLNSSYDKILYPLEGLSQEDRERLFGSEDSLAFLL